MLLTAFYTIVNFVCPVNHVEEMDSRLRGNDKDGVD
jgi:hypothetical protein